MEMGAGSDAAARGMANAPSWIVRNRSDYISSTPNRGAAVLFFSPIALYSTGHIAIVENYDDTYLYCSESNWGSSRYSGLGWRRTTYNRSDAYGYLQFPGESPGPDPGPTPTGTYTINFMGSEPAAASGIIYSAFTSGRYDTPSYSINSSVSWSDDDIDNKYLWVKCEGYNSEDYEFTT